jgi:hypothetical protein
MPDVTCIRFDGTVHQIDVLAGCSVMREAIGNDVTFIDAGRGGDRAGQAGIARGPCAPHRSHSGGSALTRWATKGGRIKSCHDAKRSCVSPV